MPKRSPESVDRDPADILIADLDFQFGIQQDLQRGITGEPDYSAVLNTEDWQAAPERVRQQLASKYGFELTRVDETVVQPEALEIAEDSPDTPPAAAVHSRVSVANEPEPKSAQDDPVVEGRPNHEGLADPSVAPKEFDYDLEEEAKRRRGNVRGRLFVGYRLDAGPEGQFVLKEKGYQGNGTKFEQLKNPKPSRIDIPTTLRDCLAEPAVRDQVLDFCNRLRKHLETALNMEPDRNLDPNGQPVMDPGKRWNLKWKYGVDTGRPGKATDETYLPVGETKWAPGKEAAESSSEQVPWNIYQAVETALADRKGATGPVMGRLLKENRLYQQWYRDMIFDKRDRVISEELAKQEFEALAKADQSAIGSEGDQAAALSQTTPAQSGSLASRFAQAGLKAAKRTVAKMDELRARSAKPAPGSATVDTKPATESIAAEGAADRQEMAGVAPAQIRQDAQPLIGPLLSAWLQIKSGDQPAQVEATTNSVVRELAKEYHRQKLIDIEDTDQIREVKTIVREAVEGHLQADHSDASGLETSEPVELMLDESDWLKTVREQMAAQVEQVSHELQQRVADERTRKLVAGLTLLIQERPEMHYWKVDRDEGRLILRNRGKLRALIRARLQGNGPRTSESAD